MQILGPKSYDIILKALAGQLTEQEAIKAKAMSEAMKNGAGLLYMHEGWEMMKVEDRLEDYLPVEEEDD